MYSNIEVDDNIPKDIETFVECFSGQFWTFFKMNIDEYPNLKTIVYNDFNPLNYNLYRCVRDHVKLLKYCERLPVQQKGEFPTPPICKETFDKIKSEIFADDFKIGDDPDFEVAAKYAYVLSQVFSGSNPAKSSFIDLKGKYHSKFSSFMNKLRDPKWQRMFESITYVENMDFQDVIEKYDGPKTYIYADPPYFKTENYYANHDFGIETHIRLADCLKNMQGKFSLSYYDFPQLSEWFPKDQYVWTSMEFHKAAMAKAGGTQTKGVELLIMNYNI